MKYSVFCWCFTAGSKMHNTRFETFGKLQNDVTSSFCLKWMHFLSWKFEKKLELRWVKPWKLMRACKFFLFISEATVSVIQWDSTLIKSYSNIWKNGVHLPHLWVVKVWAPSWRSVYPYCFRRVEWVGCNCWASRCTGVSPLDFQLPQRPSPEPQTAPF